VKVFHAGTALADDSVVTSGGRVLCVGALGDSVSAAQAAAYDACDRIHWDGAFRRSDIGYRAIRREQAAVRDA
jgi:phosphoribosylamine--glycine ligase